MRYSVTRGGEHRAGPFDTEVEAFGWLLRAQGMSTDWAIKHEGWAIVETPDERHQGYRNYETFAVIAGYANSAALYFATLDYARECLKGVPNMTPQTLGLNVKNYFRAMVNGGGWGWSDDTPRVPHDSAAVVGRWRDLDLSKVSEDELGESVFDSLTQEES